MAPLFLERVASSVVSSTWHGVFYFAGACRAVHTQLPYFKGCSRNFLLGALEHSVRSLVTCGLVGRADLSPDDFASKVLPLRSLRVLDLSGCVQLARPAFLALAQALPQVMGPRRENAFRGTVAARACGLLGQKASLVVRSANRAPI